MTEADKIEADRLETDKFEQHYRQQLSALMDGALSPDEARFLLRRLQHDAELAQCLDRWHMAGDALRGEPQAIVSAGFAEGVAALIASEPQLLPAVAPSRANRGGWRWAGGAALTASVALVALFVARQPAGSDAASSSVAAEVSAPSDTPSVTAANTPAAPIAVPPASTGESITTAAIATAAIATASVPRRNTLRRNNRSQSQRAIIRTPARAERPMVAAASATPQSESSANDVFGSATPAAPRPWPSAVFPQSSATGGFNVDYGSVSSPTFYPFEPRLPEAQRANGEMQPETDGVPAP